jgi:hypothetical protein
LELWNSIVSSATTSEYTSVKNKIENKIKINDLNSSTIEKLW